MTAEEQPRHSTTDTQESKEKKRVIPVSVVAAVFFVMVVLGALYFLSSTRQDSPPAPPSEENLAYVSQLELTELHLSAEENFLGQQVVYLDGKLTNQGEKTLQRLRVRLYFRDFMNQVVLREDQEVFGAQPVPLPPGQTREFQLRFDKIPDSWNRQVPQFQLVALQTG